MVCVDCLTYAANINKLKKAFETRNFKFYRTDIRNREEIFKIFEVEKPDVVVNFAAETHIE